MMNLALISVSGDVDRASKGFNYIPADHPGLERGIQSHQKECLQNSRSRLGVCLA